MLSQILSLCYIVIGLQGTRENSTKRWLSKARRTQYPEVKNAPNSYQVLSPYGASQTSFSKRPSSLPPYPSAGDRQMPFCACPIAHNENTALHTHFTMGIQQHLTRSMPGSRRGVHWSVAWLLRDEKLLEKSLNVYADLWTYLCMGQWQLEYQSSGHTLWRRFPYTVRL